MVLHDSFYKKTAVLLFVQFLLFLSHSRSLISYHISINTLIHFISFSRKQPVLSFLFLYYPFFIYFQLNHNNAF